MKGGCGEFVTWRPCSCEELCLWCDLEVGELCSHVFDYSTVVYRELEVLTEVFVELDHLWICLKDKVSADDLFCWEFVFRFKCVHKSQAPSTSPCKRVHHNKHRCQGRGCGKQRGLRSGGRG